MFGTLPVVRAHVVAWPCVVYSCSALLFWSTLKWAQDSTNGSDQQSREERHTISITRTTVQVNPDALRRLLAKLAEDEEAAFARRAARAAQEQRRKLEELAGREERGAGGPGGGFAGPDGSGQWVRRAPAPCPVPWCPDSSVLRLLCSVYFVPSSPQPHACDCQVRPAPSVLHSCRRQRDAEPPGSQTLLGLGNDAA